MTLSGLRPLSPDEPVCHVSLREAHALARWTGRRLSTEAGCEHAGADFYYPQQRWQFKDIRLVAHASGAILVKVKRVLRRSRS
ncbi:MAG: SUMF1/EgtB/PvdO family nonheme iron enzyme [Thiohalocapsa sp.]